MSDAPPASRPSRPSLPAASPAERRRAIGIAAVVALVSVVAVSVAFEAEHIDTPWVWGAPGVAYLGLGAWALGRLRGRGELSWAMPRSGDLSVGALVAAILYGGAMAGALAFAPHGSPREGWLMRVYLPLGDPEATGAHLVALALFVVAVLEELTWRGLVPRALHDAYDLRTAWLVTTLLYGLIHVPTLFLLAAPLAGPNPALVGAALGCGLVWGYLALRSGRLGPALFAHAFFSWAIAEFPLWHV